MNNEEKILGLLAEMKSEMSEMKSEMSEMKSGMSEMKSEISGIKGEVSGIKGEVSGIKGEISSIKEKLEEVDQRSIRTQVLLETEIRDKIQLLFDGHELLKEKLDGLAPRNRVDDLEEDVAMLKDVIKLMRIEIAELKQVQ